MGKKPRLLFCFQTFQSAAFALFAGAAVCVVRVADLVHDAFGLALDAALFEDVVHEAPFGDGGLEEVNPDEGGEEQPPLTVELRESEGQEYKCSRDEADDIFA